MIDKETKMISKHANTYCNNCSKMGHTFYNCKGPITSHGIVAFRINPFVSDPSLKFEYLMIRRKDTFGFIHFIRGKYSLHNKSYLLNIFGQMTAYEKRRILSQSFDQLWRELWARSDEEIQAVLSNMENNGIDDHDETASRSQYNSEESISREKFAELKRGITEYGMKTKYTLDTLIAESEVVGTKWTEAEWGFPKGRRNQHEKDITCALREFSEETGYGQETVVLIENMHPFEETTMGSNYKSYRNKYYMAYMDYHMSTQPHKEQTCEVSACEWKCYDDAYHHIRDYNVEKRVLLDSMHRALTSLVLVT